VIFSHYKYFDNLLDSAVSEWSEHQRESWVLKADKWVPYPFQNNIHRLPEDIMLKCLNGLVHVKQQQQPADKPKSFQQWIDRNFGPGLAEVFLNPYNYKVWAYRPEKMSAHWMGERVPTVDLPKIIHNTLKQKDDVGWGPNATFRFPVHGGTGGIWQAVADQLPKENMRIGTDVANIDVDKKRITLTTGEVIPYDYLISTVALDLLLQAIAPGSSVADLQPLSSQFVYSSTHIVGLGLKGTPPPHLKTMCWMYFPDDNSCFYRATVFSNYSKLNVPKPDEQWSLMFEISESPDKKVPDDLIKATIEGALKSFLITPEDEIISTYHHRLERGYPTPFIGRDELLEKIQPRLQALGVWSRGRFGGWKYEVGNQDHSLMQGVEAVDAALFGVEEQTYFYPDLVNSRPKSQTTRAYKNPAAAGPAK
jgi:protoporphyrinogen oxidase